VAGGAGWLNDGLLGGSAPVCAHIPELLDDALEGRIDPGRVLDFETGLDGIAEAYAAMDERRAIKVAASAGQHKKGTAVIGWTSDELTKIDTADELEIASTRRDGTLRRPTTIWVVRLGDDLYVRSVNGRTAVWFRGTRVRHEGRIRAGGVEKEVAFADVDEGIDDQIDDAYREKYRRYSSNIVGSVLTTEARSATIKLVPR
jgi:hypothetical protein